MAFNPFASFRKYQKYWMAGAVLVCMLTFVLCSGGMKGTGLDDLLLGWTRRRGEDYVKVNSRGYSYEELNQLKDQRNVANDFMREIHDRMPVILDRSDEDAWLDPEVHEQEKLQRLFKPCPSSWLAAVEVSSLVNSAKNNSPEILEPAIDLNRGRTALLFE